MLNLAFSKENKVRGCHVFCGRKIESAPKRLGKQSSESKHVKTNRLVKIFAAA